MEYFRFVPPTLLVISATVVAMPNPQVLFGGGVGGSPAAPSPSAAPPAAAAPSLPASATRLAPAANTRFLGFGGPRPQQAQPQFQQQQAQTQAQFQQQQAQAQAQFQQQQAQAQAQFQQQQAQAQPQFQQQQAQAQPQFQQQQQSPQRQQVFGGFGPFIPAVNANNNQGLANLGAGAGLAGVGAFAAGNCLFGQNCDLSFRPSLGASIDANGQIVPQLGVTTQVGDGRGGIGTTFTGGLQLDGNSQNGVGGFVAGGINDGNADGVGLGAQTGFGFSQNAQGSLDATAQIGGNVQAPQLAGVQFNRPNTALGVQPTLLGQARPEFNLFNLFGGR